MVIQGLRDLLGSNIEDFLYSFKGAGALGDSDSELGGCEPLALYNIEFYHI